MTQLLQAIGDHITIITKIGIGLGTIIGFRKYIFAFFRRIHRCATRPERIEKALQAFPQMAGDIIEIKRAIFNGGKNGIIHAVELLNAQANADFESDPVPKFICDNRGGNVRVNQAYRHLVQVWRDEDIHDTQWMAVITGPLRQAYIEEFLRCATSGNDFFGDVDFHNPATNQHRGRWKIYAPSSKRGDGSSIYVGTFVGALCPVAAEIAKDNHWRVPVMQVE